MQIHQLRTIHSWVRSTTISEILFVSALILPVYLLLYDFAFDQLDVSWKELGLACAVLIFGIGIFWMKLSQSRDEKDARDLAVIRNYILDQDFQYMSYEKLSSLDSDYDEARIRQLISIFPNELRQAKLADKKRGIKVLNVEVEDR